jgi:hypothetical protein
MDSFNARLRDELLDGEMFHSVAEARMLIERWRRRYDEKRPHSSLGYRPPAPEVVLFEQRKGRLREAKLVRESLIEPCPPHGDLPSPIPVALKDGPFCSCHPAGICIQADLRRLQPR